MAASHLEHRSSMLVRCARIVGLLSISVSIAACSVSAMADAFTAEQGTFEKTVAVGDSPVSVDAYTASGDITVRHGNDREVHVVGHVRVYSQWWRWSSISPQEALARLQQNPPVEQQGNSIRVGYISDPDLTRSIAISYEIEVPGATRLSARISSGSVNVDGINGPVEASTSSGHVTLTNIKGAVTASSSSGGIDLRSIDGAATASVSSGSISGSELMATSAKTMSGRVTLHQVRGACEVFVTSGSISVDGAPTAPWNLHNISGRVSIRVSDQSHFELKAHVGSGGIRNSLPVTILGSSSNNLLVGSVGGGGPLVDLSTQSGYISIE